MPTWMKVLLVVGVLLVLLVVGVGVAGYFLVRTYGPELKKAGLETYNEGMEYGRRTDQEGCVNEAAARHAHAEGLTDQIKNTVFMRACLEASRPTPGFCDTVPHRFEFTKTVNWQVQQCQRYKLPPEKQCGQLFTQVQQFCETPHARRENSNAPDTEVNPEDEPPPPPSRAR